MVPGREYSTKSLKAPQPDPASTPFPVERYEMRLAPGGFQSVAPNVQRRAVPSCVQIRSGESFQRGVVSMKLCVPVCTDGYIMIHGYMYTHMHILSTYLSICSSIYLPMFLCFYLSSIHPSVPPSIHPSLYPIYASPFYPYPILSYSLSSLSCCVPE